MTEKCLKSISMHLLSPQDIYLRLTMLCIVGNIKTIQVLVCASFHLFYLILKEKVGLFQWELGSNANVPNRKSGKSGSKLRFSIAKLQIAHITLNLNNNNGKAYKNDLQYFLTVCSMQLHDISFGKLRVDYQDTSTAREERRSSLIFREIWVGLHISFS